MYTLTTCNMTAKEQILWALYDRIQRIAFGIQTSAKCFRMCSTQLGTKNYQASELGECYFFLPTCFKLL